MSTTTAAKTFEIVCDRCNGLDTRYRSVGYGNKCFKCHGAGKVAVSEDAFRAAQDREIAGRRQDAIKACASQLRRLTDLGAETTRAARQSQANRLSDWLDDKGAEWCPTVRDRFLAALRRYVETGSAEKEAA